VGLVPRNYLQELSEYLAEPYRGGRSLERPTNGGGSLRAVSQASLALHDRPHLVGKPWYYGPITRAHCDTILNEAGQDGDFLVRDSETNVSGQLCQMTKKVYNCAIKADLINFGKMIELDI
jgi:NCK adaptor protein 2